MLCFGGVTLSGDLAVSRSTLSLLPILLPSASKRPLGCRCLGYHDEVEDEKKLDACSSIGIAVLLFEPRQVSHVSRTSSDAKNLPMKLDGRQHDSHILFGARNPAALHVT